MTFRRFVAIGDSLTEGKGDVYPDGRLRGFADLLAHSLREVDDRVAYANLARPSVRTHEVLAHQVGAAVAFQPDLVTAVAGVNDVIAVAFPARGVADRLDAVLGRLREGAPDATILTATLPDLGHLSAVARLWRPRMSLLNEAIRVAAERHCVALVDLDAMPPMGRDDVALDRVHPSPLGHVRIAAAFAASLGLPMPSPEYLAARPRAEHLLRLYRTAVVAPRFVTRRMARRALISSQPAKRPDLLPL